MPRKPLIRTKNAVYHVTSRLNNQDWFVLPMKEVMEIFISNFHRYSDFKTEIHSFVLMSNHFHMMVSTPLENLDTWLRSVLTQVSKEILRRSGRTNHIFGSRYHWTLCWEPWHVAYVYKYVARNPVRAGLSSRIEEYPFSTFSEVCRKMGFPLSEPIGPLWSFLPQELDERLSWLNLPTPKESETLIKMALKKYEFKFSKRANIQKNLRALHEAYGLKGLFYWS